MILAIGFRVRSMRGTQFRQWANRHLSEYMVKGVPDIFGGSNTTGFTAEALRRKWITFEINQDYLSSSVFRFLDGQSKVTG